MAKLYLVVRSEMLSDRTMLQPDTYISRQSSKAEIRDFFKDDAGDKLHCIEPIVLGDSAKKGYALISAIDDDGHHPIRDAIERITTQAFLLGLRFALDDHKLAAELLDAPEK